MPSKFSGWTDSTEEEVQVGQDHVSPGGDQNPEQGQPKPNPENPTQQNPSNQEAFQMMGDMIKGEYEAFGNFVMNALSAGSRIVEGVVTDGLAVVETVIDVVSLAGNIVSGDLTGVGEEIADIGGNLEQAVQGVVRIGGGIGDLLNSLGSYWFPSK